MPTAKAASKKPVKTANPPKAKTPTARMTLAQAMAALEKAGSAQTRKTYARHGAPEPMFGVSFGMLKTLLNQIKIDQPLAEALWSTGNYDARNLAAKVCDPATISPKVLDSWAACPAGRICGAYVGQIAAEGPHGGGRAKAEKWLAAKDEPTRFAGWSTVAAMAMIDENEPDAWFTDHLTQIEKTIHAAPNAHRAMMNQTLIAIGCRSAAFRKAATAAAKRIGPVNVDHGDTDCKTPDAVAYIDKAWARSKDKGFDSPGAQERSRESMRTRC